MKKENDKNILFRKKVIFSWVLGLISFFVSNYATAHTDWTESFFSLYLYPKIKATIGFLPDVFTFSLFEIVIVTVILVIIIYITLLIKKLKKRTNIKMILVKSVTDLLAIGCVIYFIFTFTCGLNYYRYPFNHYANYQVNETNINNTDELEELLLFLTNKLNSTQNLLDNKEFSSYGEDSVKAMKDLSKEYPVFSYIDYSKPKPLVSSKLFSKLGIGGIFFPFTFESNINTDIPNYLLPATMTHELAHQAGFMREDEAHFISYLACINSEDSSLKYSGYFLAFYQTIKLLEKEEPQKADKIINHLSDNVKQDFIDYERYIEGNQGMLQKISHHTNDLYLKSNNQNNGIDDYSRMVNLVLAHYKKEFVKWKLKT